MNSAVENYTGDEQDYEEIKCTGNLSFQSCFFEHIFSKNKQILNIVSYKRQ